jgi:hypothetical protein
MVGPEIAAFPLWNRSPTGFPGMLRSSALPISDGLVERMTDWNEFFEVHDTAEGDDTATEQEWEAWEAVGRSLSAELQVEIGDSVRVYFYLDDLSEIPPYDPSWIPKFTSGSFSLIERED